jgi:trimethylamine--corrinoid protein Co-methyltransferase
VRPRLELFAREDVDRIVDDALAVLATVGFAVESRDASDLLRSAGVAERSGRFFAEESAVRGALASAPRRFALYDRDGAPAVRYGEGEVHFDPGSAAIHLLDGETDERRLATTPDLVSLARLVDVLPAYAAQATALVPSDVPEAIADRWRLYVALTQGRKPVVTGTFRKDGFAPMRALLAAVRGGERELAERPLAIFDCCPTSPLKWSDLTAQALLDAVRAGLPVQTVPVPMTGATSPVTLREAVVQQVAEGLSGLLLAQLARPGAAVVLGGAPSAFDMRHGTAAMGAIESAMLNVGHAQVARHLGLPCHGYLALSDSKLVDYQAGMESTAGAIIGALGGIDLISGPGLLDYLLTQSLEKLLLDHEACASALRLVRGIGIGEPNGVALIGEAARLGQLLGHPHTRRHFREELTLASRLIDRQSYGDWAAAGQQDAACRARDEVRRLLRESPLPPLADHVGRELETIITAEAARAGLGRLPGLRAAHL